MSSWQCCGSITFWCGSGSADSCLWLVDPDPEPGPGSSYFRHWPSRCQQKKQISKHFFLFNTFLRYIYIIFLNVKVKESQNSRNQGFSYNFCMVVEGSGSGSIPLTNGSGFVSGRPKKMWIRCWLHRIHMLAASWTVSSQQILISTF